MHRNLKKYLGLIGLLIVIVPIFPSFQLNELRLDEVNDFVYDKSIISANPSILPIFIDDSDPNYNWSKTAHENVWCSGSGSWSEPYVIKDLTINGNNTGSCIEIRNSNVYFKIENCTLFNCSSGNFGLYLYNANNSMLLENNCSFNFGSGIGVSNSFNNTIMKNFATNNTSLGMGLWWGTNNTISNNTFANNRRGILIHGTTEYNAIENNLIYGNSEDSSNSAGIYISDCSRVSVTNNTIFENNHGIYFFDGSNNNVIKGNNISSNIQNGIYREGGNHNKYINNTIFNNGYDGIQLSSGDICWNNTISSCNVGIDAQGCSNARIMNNTIINCRNGIDIAFSCYNITISQNSLTNSSISIGAYYDQIPTYNITKTNLVNGKPVYFYKNKSRLTAANFSNPGQIILFNSNNSFISDLSVLGGITLLFCNNITLSNNFIQSQLFGLDLEFCNDCNLFENTIFDSYYAMYLRNILNCNISENQVLDSLYGITLVYSNNNTFYGNNCTDNLLGIGTSHSNENNFIQNSFSNNMVGIMISSGGNNSINNNIAVNNSWHGIWIQQSSDNDLISNSIHKNNITGLAITLDSNNNLIFNNTFIGNTLNAQDDGTNNQWDNGSLGNIWDDYSGIDADHDNIGDTPYNISGLAGSKDNFPIFSPRPNISIVSPLEFSLFGSSPPQIDLLEESVNTDTIWYFLDNGTIITNNYTFTGSINQGVWNLVGNGTVRIKFYINDTLGKIDFDEILVRKDIIAPQIRINSPTSLTVFEEDSPTFDLSIIEGNLDTIWYSLDSGINNYQCGTSGQINQALWDSLSEEDITIRFYANDTLGNVDFVEITVTKSIPETQPPPAIPGYNITFLLGIISVIMILKIKKLSKK